MMTPEQAAPSYRHTQIGYALIVCFAVAGVGIIGASLGTGEPRALFVLPAIAVAEALFFSLTVTVDETAVQLRFGIGLIRKTIRLSEVTACDPVRNHPLCGWGIRYIGRGWLFNVSGLDAVELALKDGRRIRIGTDDPHGLTAAIRRMLTTRA
jgi:hypothetical protein